MKMITNKETDADARHPGRRPEGHRPGRGGAGLRAPFDAHVVRRTMVTLQHRVLTTTETGRELAHGCVSCTIRNDLLALLHQLHRRDDIDVMMLRRPGRANHPALVEQILADVFSLPGVTDTNDGYDRTFLSRIALAQRVS
jgi:hypothetical protein